MAVKILIKRKVPSSLLPNLLPLLKEMRSMTMDQPGYISGETFRRVDREDENLVISTWQSVDDWRAWVMSSERRTVQEKIDSLLGSETDYEVYEYQ
jgi:heme-degrading monooxygenase HmoA